MNTCQIHTRTKWIVIPTWSAPFGVSHINWKLPSNVKNIRGVAFTLSEYEGEILQEKIGEVSLQVNDKLTHPLNWDIEAKSKYSRIDKELLPLSVAITKGSTVTGYYKNLSDKEHKLSIYLQTDI